MGAETKIQWTDHTWNPWRGCANATLPDGTPHPGCLNCYAESGAKRNPGMLGEWGPEGTRIKAVDATFDAPLKWNRAAEKTGERRRVFVDSWSDFFEEFNGPVSDHTGNILDYAPPSAFTFAPMPVRLSHLRAKAFDIIDRCPWLDFQILTKRPQNIGGMWLEAGPTSYRKYRPNVWLLYSASDQESYDAGIYSLCLCRDLVPVLGISAEPLVGPINLRLDEDDPGLDWVIPGGESGRRARRCEVAWIRSIRDQCDAAGVACFIKQLGKCPIFSLHEGVGRWLPDITHPKGGDWDEWPADLRVRQFPKE